MVDEVISELKLKVSHDDKATLGVLSKEEAKEFKIEWDSIWFQTIINPGKIISCRIPENFQLRSLSTESASIIQKSWKHLPDFSTNSIPYMIENNINVGLFNDKSELVAWCLVFDCGSIGALHVDEFNRRKGFGEIVTKAISKKIAEENNVDVLTDYIDGNYQSESLMKKIGFKSVGKVRWIGAVKVLEWTWKSFRDELWPKVFHSFIVKSSTSLKVVYGWINSRKYFPEFDLLLIP